MPPRRKLSTFDKTRAIAWIQDGVAKAEVARRLGVHHSIIIRLHQRFRATNSVEERPRSGAPRKTTPREDRFIERQALLRHDATSTSIQRQLQMATNTNLSRQAIQNRLHHFGLRSRRPAVRPRLLAAHRHARRAFCRCHVRWNHQQWSRVSLATNPGSALNTMTAGCGFGGVPGSSTLMLL